MFAARRGQERPGADDVQRLKRRGKPEERWGFKAWVVAKTTIPRALGAGRIGLWSWERRRGLQREEDEKQNGRSYV